MVSLLATGRRLNNMSMIIYRFSVKYNMNAASDIYLYADRLCTDNSFTIAHIYSYRFNSKYNSWEVYWENHWSRITQFKLLKILNEARRNFELNGYSLVDIAIRDDNK